MVNNRFLALLLAMGPSLGIGPTAWAEQQGLLAEKGLGPGSAEDTDGVQKIPVRVVLVTMFEIGEDEGDQAGEFQLWKERRALNERFAFPQSHHDLFYNRDSKILGMVTGVGTAKSAAAIMALGLDPRFDLTQSYWLVAGIAGIDPEDASIGSAVWSSYLVDGDLAHEIDPRETPADWPHGYFAWRPKRPLDPSKPEPRGELFIANESLTDWAYELTKDVALPDTEGLQAERVKYTEHPLAQQSPAVYRGGHLAAMTFWHGALLNAWANDWVDYWSEGKADFVTSGMEETGTFQSLEYLDRAGRVDRQRALVLRAGSNYTMPPPGRTAAQSMAQEGEGFSGLNESLEALYRVGSVVIDELLENWDKFEAQRPDEFAEPSRSAQ